MLSFQQIYERAAELKGGTAALEARLPQPRSAAELGAIPDHRFLAQMTKSIFQSGFVWQIVEAKWEGFERAFYGFDPQRWADLPEDALRTLMDDDGVIRNWQKIKAVGSNARFVVAMAERHRGFGHFLAQWPVEDITGLWLELKNRGERLGGNTGPFFLRAMGKDTFLLTRDVSLALTEQGIIGKNPHAKQSLKAAQQAFNRWRTESGRPLCHISRILAATIPAKPSPSH